LSTAGQPAAAGTKRSGWLQAVLVYRQPRILSMLLLGFSAGLPFFLVFQTLSAWLRQDGIQRATIGMLAWVGIVYSIKFLWAPVVDRTKLPLLYRLFGRRRSWMLLAQAGIAIGLLNLSFSALRCGPCSSRSARRPRTSQSMHGASSPHRPRCRAQWLLHISWVIAAR
jgi:PAT family beta-lactamase induction signal transducer AmpG